MKLTLLDVLNSFDQRVSADMQTCGPAKVVSYDASAQRAELEPLWKETYRRADGDERYSEALPVLPNVPVMFPRGGGFFLSTPLQPGDTGIVIFTKYSLESFLETGRSEDPGDLRQFDLAGSVFIPGLFPNDSPIEDASGSDMVMGADGSVAQIAIKTSTVEAGGASSLALATPTQMYLDGLKVAVEALVAASTIPAPAQAALLAALNLASAGSIPTAVLKGS